MDKQTIIGNVIAKLEAELALCGKAARPTHTEATDEQSKAVKRHDTRGLEASCLARGQSRQAAELEQSIAEFRALPPREFTADTPIEVGALVELVAGKERNFYFLGPRAGGIEVRYGGKEVTVITPRSPLGSQLVGRKAGDRVWLGTGGARRELRVALVR